MNEVLEQIRKIGIVPVVKLDRAILCTRGVGIPIRFTPAAPLPLSPPAPAMQRALQGTLSLG